ncbi:MAG: cyclic pyranopterin monophosphate synthase MoaC [Clostridia bacterium]|nr:cyclic pyranopterin monophosphate synthase MoaC [Clostridia bacterium]MCL6522409.1 cyclic pyranopterin monophosphate synthase MoaC [Bacillota bacterium]
MVDVGAKPESERVAVARGAVRMRPETLERIARGDLPKGDVFAVARVAGILAAKRVDELIPLCHPVPLSSVRVDLRGRPPEPGGDGLAAVEIEAEARTVARTGVEMEALAAVSVAALTVYDMCKAVDRAMEVEAVRLVYKRGGRSGTFLRAGEPLPPGLEEGPGDPASPVGGAQDTPGE